MTRPRGFVDWRPQARTRAIRDDGVTEKRAWGYTSVVGFWSSTLSGGWSFRFLRQDGQPRHVECWVEAAGMVPLVARTVEDYGVDVYSCGGFDSLTFKHQAAQRFAWRDVPTVVLHVGDHDPSGVALYQAVAEDVEAMSLELPGGGVEFERIAVTPEQVERYSLPTAPAKSTDRRGA